MAKVSRGLLLALVLFCLSCFLGHEAHAAALVQFSLNKKTGSETLKINLQNNEPNKVFMLPNPDRLVVDVPLIGGKQHVDIPKNYNGKLVKSVRYAEFDAQTSRFVFDLTGAVKVISATVSDDELQVEITPRNKKQDDNSIFADSSEQDEADSDEIKPQKPAPPKIAGKEKGTTSLPTNNKSSPKNAMHSSSRSIDYPPLVIIDAGHGGIDPGTIGANGTQEKGVVLEYALALRDKLLKSGKYKVKLTRNDDVFIPLAGRVAIARKAKANLFISIHADSADEDLARGLSVYTVSEKASDQAAERLAARENKSDIIGGMDLSGEREDVADILISLAQRETKNNSALFADILVLTLADKVRLLPNTHRFAGFAVLKAPDIPSVLVEVGFLSHPAEEKLLKSKNYREKVISGIAAGIDSYFSKKKAGS